MNQCCKNLINMSTHEIFEFISDYKKPYVDKMDWETCAILCRLQTDLANEFLNYKDKKEVNHELCKGVC